MPWGHWFQWIYYNLTGFSEKFPIFRGNRKTRGKHGIWLWMFGKQNQSQQYKKWWYEACNDSTWHMARQSVRFERLTSILKSSNHKSHCSEFCNLAASLWNPAIKQSTLYQGPPVIPDYNQKHHGGPGGIKQDYDNTKQLWRKNTTKSRKIILLSPLYNVVH